MNIKDIYILYKIDNDYEILDIGDDYIKRNFK